MLKDVISEVHAVDREEGVAEFFFEERVAEYMQSIAKRE